MLKFINVDIFDGNFTHQEERLNSVIINSPPYIGRGLIVKKLDKKTKNNNKKIKYGIFKNTDIIDFEIDLFTTKNGNYYFKQINF